MATLFTPVLIIVILHVSWYVGRGLIYSVNNTNAWLPAPDVHIAGGFPNSEGITQSASYAEITIETVRK